MPVPTEWSLHGWLINGSKKTEAKLRPLLTATWKSRAGVRHTNSWGNWQRSSQRLTQAKGGRSLIKEKTFFLVRLQGGREGMAGALTWGWAKERQKGYRCLPLLFVFFYSPGWPWICYVDQADPELTDICQCLSLLGLQTYKMIIHVKRVHRYLQ